MKEQKYTEDGYLVVSETDSCPLWEKDTVPSIFGCMHDCFYCRFTDFRTEETIIRAQLVPQGTKLYSICHNEANRK